ncbi:MAG: stage II sporulation protein P, partial [Clostridia bacterium]|nr:stage II sporulation protein P [Clostridia bacterium]
DSYAAEIGGRKASKVRLLVGRGNQNMSVNRNFAAQIKAVADKVYPGLIKDIYMGKGTYNQDLAPKSLLFECGTYTLDKERVLTSMPMMADVVSRALYGGIVGSAGSRSSAGSASSAEDDVTQGEPDSTPVQEDARGAGAGVLWLIGLGVIGLVIFAFASKGSGGAAHKIGRNLSEMTGGLIGKKPRDGEPRA